MTVDVRPGLRTLPRVRPLAEREAVLRRTEWRLFAAGTVASLIGAVAVFLYLNFVVSSRVVPGARQVQHLYLEVFVAYLVVSIGIGAMVGRRALTPVRRWVRAGRAPTAGERDWTMRVPLVEAALSAAMWLGAAGVFSWLDAAYAPQFTGRVFLTIALGGVTTTAFDYLLVERLMRPVFVYALEQGLPDCPLTLGVFSRVVVMWVLCTGVPLVAIAVAYLTTPDAERGHLVVGTYALVAGGLLAGFVSTLLVAKSIGEPVGAIRTAMAQVGAGRTDVQVPVYDASEIGLLQTGFNEMVTGLREHRLLKDLFGRQVGPDVMQHALERGPLLGGEVLDVAVLFVDVVGSSRLAAARDAPHVVELLNRFFGVVVEVVAAHDGYVNKFMGDAALCVFGAPTPNPHAHTCALSAARELRDRLARLDGLDFGIGISAGLVVAGNVGAEMRYEYTVIGDPVNEAARLTELAKQEPERLLASGSVLDRADEAEAARWTRGETVTLRGRPRPTTLAAPVAAGG